MKTCKIILLFFCTFGMGQGFAQEADSTFQQKFSKGFYRKPDGRLFVAQSLPVFLHLSTSPEEVGQFLATGDKGPAEILLSEGKNTLQIPTAVYHPEDGRKENVTLEVWADGTPPQLSVLFETAAKFNSETTTFYGPGLEFNLQRKDALSGVRGTFMSVNGRAFSPFDSTKLDFFQNGRFFLRYYSVDNVGNVSEIQETFFTVDVTAPHTVRRISGFYKDNILSPQALIQLGSSDSLSGVKEIYYQLDDKSETVYQEELAVRELTDGEHVLLFYSMDNVNNQEQKQVWPFFLDKTPPELIYKIVGDVHDDTMTTFVSERSSIAITGTDSGAGLANIYYSINGGEESLYQHPITLDRFRGLMRIRYTGRDSVENRTRTFNRKIYVDPTPPESVHELKGSVLSLGDTVLINNETRISLGATDMESGVREILYSIDGQDGPPYRGPFYLTEEGVYRLEYYAIDKVNNTEKTHVVLLRVDNSPRRPVTSAPPSTHPKVWQEREPGAPVGSTELPFYLQIATGPDKTSESFLLDLSSVVTKDTKPLYFDNEGQNDLTLRMLGRQVSFQIPIDGTPPVTRAQFEGATRAIQNDTVYYGPGLSVTLNAADEKKSVVSGLARTFYSIDGSEFIRYRGRITLFDREKEYDFRYYAVDSVGNAESMHRHSFIVDTSPPRTRLSVGGTYYGNTLAAKSIISLTSVDHLSGTQTIYYQFDEGEKNIYSGELTGAHLENLSPGRHTLQYYAVDFVGNTEQRQRFEFYYDPDRPSVAQHFVGDQYESQGRIYVSGDAKIVIQSKDPTSDVKNIMAGLNRDSPGSYTGPLSVPKTNGKHSVTFFAMDLLDNKTPMITKSFFVDVVPPRTTLSFRGPQYFDGERLYISNRTEIILNSRDAASGVDVVRYRVGQRAWQVYGNPVRVNSFGDQRFLYYAQDQVKNREASQSRRFFVDNKKPEISISSSIPQIRGDGAGQFKIPRSAAIYLSANDTHAGIDVITYKVNRDAEQIYRIPITGFNAGDTIDLNVTARDRVGNTSQKRIIYQIVKDQ